MKKKSFYKSRGILSFDLIVIRKSILDVFVI